MKLIEHPLDLVRRLAHILEEQDPAVDARKMRRAQEMHDHRQVAAPQRALAREIGAVECALDFAAVAAEQLPAMVERERGGRFGSEIKSGHRARERRHADARKCGQLERGEVAVAHPSLAGSGQRCEIQPLDEPRPAVAAADANGQFDVRMLRHARHGSEAFVVHPRKSLPAHRARRVDHDAVPECGETRRGAIDGGRLGRKTRGRKKTDAVAARVHVEDDRRPEKKSDKSLPHSSASTPPTTAA